MSLNAPRDRGSWVVHLHQNIARLPLSYRMVLYHRIQNLNFGSGTEVDVIRATRLHSVTDRSQQEIVNGTPEEAPGVF